MLHPEMKGLQKVLLLHISSQNPKSTLQDCKYEMDQTGWGWLMVCIIITAICMPLDPRSHDSSLLQDFDLSGGGIRREVPLGIHNEPYWIPRNDNMPPALRPVKILVG